MIDSIISLMVAKMNFDGIPVCCDFSVAKSFSSPDELLKWVCENTSLRKENGDFHIEGHYFAM